MPIDTPPAAPPVLLRLQERFVVTPAMRDRKPNELVDFLTLAELQELRDFLAGMAPAFAPLERPRAAGTRSRAEEYTQRRSLFFSTLAEAFTTYPGTRAELARYAGVSHGVLSAHLTGKTIPYKQTVAERLADALKCPAILECWHAYQGLTDPNTGRYLPCPMVSAQTAHKGAAS